jgi:L-aspartate oxidase
VEAVHRTAAVVHENTFALDIVEEGGRCAGIRAVAADNTVRTVAARHVLLATGGAGQIFAVTTNPLEATGDGIAMALRAGVAVADVEFVQFHPTALHHPQMPRPLLSEALRGHGALLRDANGKRFVDELLPRDEVSRAETRRMLDQGVEHLWLDATGLESFDQRFPTIAAELRAIGLDPSTDWLPIAPAAHYLCGGVVADLDGATDLPGLWAAGEVACSGVHGANRLASNSLLEGMVFGFRVVEAIERGKAYPEPTGAMRAVLGGDGDPMVIGGRTLPGSIPSAPDIAVTGEVETVRDGLQRVMTSRAGVLRSDETLREALVQIAAHAAWARQARTIQEFEIRNLADLAMTMVVAALARRESRGAHTRADHPARDDEQFRFRFVSGGARATGLAS